MQDEKVTPPLPTRSREASRPRTLDDDSSACATGATRYLIIGVTRQGRTFRPSDWAERLAGVVALFVDERGARTTSGPRHFAGPIVHNGVKSLTIDATLREACPGAFAFLLGFADDNDLTLAACPE